MSRKPKLNDDLLRSLLELRNVLVHMEYSTTGLRRLIDLVRVVFVFSVLNRIVGRVIRERLNAGQGPPTRATSLLEYIVPPKDQEEVLEHMAVRFEAWCEKYGAASARRKYWGHVLWNVVPAVLRPVLKFKGIIAVIEAIGRIAS